ncbi:hypothetical protein [Tateyamaria sp.]|uniref:hypothetical protein n=1 Tax=Tateyamaria sp. TaxID=1929288 RepID=UPI00329E8B04
MPRACAIAALGLAFLAGPALAQDAAQTCAKMDREDRLGPLTVAQCHCNYSVADQVLDADIRALLFDAWYTGVNNTAKVEALKPASRVRRQFSRLQNELKKHCS